MCNVKLWRFVTCTTSDKSHKRLRWYGDVVRREEIHWIQKAIHFLVTGLKPWGRPCDLPFEAFYDTICKWGLHPPPLFGKLYETGPKNLTWKRKLLGQPEGQPSEGKELRLQFLLLELQPDLGVATLDHQHQLVHLGVDPRWWVVQRLDEGVAHLGHEVGEAEEGVCFGVFCRRGVMVERGEEL